LISACFYFHLHPDVILANVVDRANVNCRLALAGNQVIISGSGVSSLAACDHHRDIEDFHYGHCFGYFTDHCWCIFEAKEMIFKRLVKVQALRRSELQRMYSG